MIWLLASDGMPRWLPGKKKARYERSGSFLERNSSNVPFDFMEQNHLKEKYLITKLD